MRPISFPKLPDFGVLHKILQILNLEPRSLLYSSPPSTPPLVSARIVSEEASVQISLTETTPPLASMENPDYGPAWPC